MIFQNDITYIHNYKFDDCIYKNKLPFDFAVFCNGLLTYVIEYDGKQHYESVEYYGGDKQLQIQQIRDQIKTNYCEINKINLIRIPY